jgi:hypothetical protein
VPPAGSAPTSWQEVAPIIKNACALCHVWAGNETEFAAHRVASASMVAGKLMPTPGTPMEAGLSVADRAKIVAYCNGN